MEGYGFEEILAQPQSQGPSIPPEKDTKATKGKESSPSREGTKEEQKKIFVEGRCKIGPRAGTPRAPAPAKKAIKGSTKETNPASEDEDTPRQQQVRGEVDRNEDELALCGNQRRKTQDDKREGDSRKSSLPSQCRSHRPSTANSKKKKKNATRTH